MDDSTADFNSTALNPRRPQDSQNIRGRIRSSDLDRRHRFTAVAVYDIPFFKNRGFIVRNLLGNYELAPSYTFQSPQLTTVQSAVSSVLNNDSAADRSFIDPTGVKGTASGVVAIVNPGIPCTAATGTGVVNGFAGTVVNSCAANTIGYREGSIINGVFIAKHAQYVQGGLGTLPTAPRNTLPTGRTNNLDLSAYKHFSFHERYKLDFGLQAINVLNHSQYLPGSPDAVNSIGSTGTVRNFDTVTSAQFNVKQLVFSNNPRTDATFWKDNFLRSTPRANGKRRNPKVPPLCCY